MNNGSSFHSLNEKVIKETLKKLDDCFKSIKIVREFIPELVNKELVPFRVISIRHGICLAFKKDDLRIYVEFYNDGDIGLISEDCVEKRILDNIDLTKENLIPTLKGILKNEVIR